MSVLNVFQIIIILDRFSTNSLLNKSGIEEGSYGKSLYRMEQCFLEDSLLFHFKRLDFIIYVE